MKPKQTIKLYAPTIVASILAAGSVHIFMKLVYKHRINKVMDLIDKEIGLSEETRSMIMNIWRS